MANNKDYSDSENILVKVDQNNLIYVDPNSVIDSKGEIHPRGFKQENLVMYVNLEADLIPRTVLITDNDKGNTLTQIASGNLNFLKNATGDGNFDTTWTEAFVPKPIQGQESNYKDGENQFKDTSGQSFGIDSISISIKGANFVPSVNISFVDVRGKTLFESSENSPYRAFFHLPWPIFYLTVKGYYGKAIRYRLHMTKFSSRFNESNGNFEISTIFVGSTYAWMNDITLSQIITSPYMFLVEENKDTSFNEKTGLYEKRVSHSSRGYQILKSVYRQYEQKGLIPKGFPVRTLTEMGYIAESLDKILEQKIFSGVDMGVFQGIKELDETINNYENSFRAWAKKNLSNESKEISTNEFWYYLSLKEKTSLEKIIIGDENGTLQRLVNKFNEDIKKSKLFTQNLLKNNTTGDFKKISIRNLKNVTSYYKILNDKKVVVNIDGIFNDIFQIRKSFEEQRKKVEDDVETRMNEIIKGSEGFGFEPTVRNMFAVLLANAEVYIRLMKDVHNKAFNASFTRKNAIKNLSKESKGEDIYPWPEISKPQQGGKTNVIAYPGDEQLIHKLESYDSTKWPEVDFVEQYITILTNRVETNVNKESTRNDFNYVFDSNADINKVSPISTTDFIINRVPYIDKEYSNFLYEIYERARFLTMFDSFTNEMLTELANEEFNNIKISIKEDGDLIELAKKIKSIDDFIKIEYEKIDKDNNGNIIKDENGKPKTYTEYGGYLYLSSPYDKFSYYKDTLPTTNYLIETLNEPFKFESYNLNVTLKGGGLDETKLNNSLLNYQPESYRKNIYPFNSNTYLSYINKTTFSDDNFKFNGILKYESSNGFISSPISPTSWVKSGGSNLTNFFLNSVNVTGNTVSILNTPYFHNQLYYDFNKSTINGKYVGSAYLLLNSLPFVDLDDQITFDNKTILTSSLFREISSTHFVPYHLLLKWGSIYHRYKTHLIDGVDILGGAINSSYVSRPLSGQTLFDNNSGYTFTIVPKISTTTGSTTGVTYTGYTNVGLSPFYQSIYSQIVNGYTHYDVSLGNLSYSANTINNSILHRVRTQTQMNYWDVLMDNTKYKTEEKTYTLLPSIGGYSDTKINPNNTFDFAQQIGFRTLWFIDDTINNSFSGQTFPTPYDYFRTTGNTYSISTNYKKAIDLIGTFSPTILEYFESYFLDFATQKMNDEIPYKTFENLNFPKFQDILTRLSVIDKINLPQDPISLSDIDLLITNLKQKQKEASEIITSSILGSNNLIQFSLANPKEIDPFILYGMTKSNPNTTYATESFSSFDINTINQNFIKLYIGEDVDGYYLEFFNVNNIKLTENNIKTHRPIAQIYGGYRKNGGTISRSSFVNYLKDEIIIKNSGNNLVSNGSDIRFRHFLTQLLNSFSTLNSNESKNPASRIDMFRGYNSDATKLELYNTFKSFNDKWTSGNSIGQRLLLEEFLFLDKANRDIGDKLYLNIDRFKDLLNPKNLKVSLYGAISMLIQGTGLDMRALPAYINFYGNNVNIKNKIRPSKKVASDLFGTFLEVDYQDATPKIIIQLVGYNSKRLDMTNSKPYKFVDDSFYIGSQNNNPLLITSLESFSRNDLSKSNRVVAFEVSFGDQNQGIFKGLTLDQSSLKNTSESFYVLENLSRSASGAGVYNVDVSLFDYYKQASYKCDVTAMGNVMIQPTMFFYLKNVPMFKGSYWITEVTHTIKSNNISTTFSGARIPYSSLPDPKDSFIASYRVLFDKIQSRASSIIKQRERNNTDTQEKVTYQKIDYITDRGGIIIEGEQPKDSLIDSGINKFGVPYNGFNEQRTVQKVTNNNQTWLRAIAVQMGGPNYPINSSTSMNIANGIEFSKIQNTNYRYFMVNFQLSRQITPELIRTAKTIFKNPNPKNNKTVTLNPNYQLDSDLGTIVAEGPVSIGPLSTKYGIGLSPKLMSELGLHDGQVVYFNME